MLQTIRDIGWLALLLQSAIQLCFLEAGCICL